jgi:hypothetical protein
MKNTNMEMLKRENDVQNGRGWLKILVATVRIT